MLMRAPQHWSGLILVMTLSQNLLEARASLRWPRISHCLYHVGDPVGLGLVASLAHPGRNVTGFAYSVGLEVFGKQLEFNNIKSAALALGLQPHLLGTRDPDEFEAAFAEMVKEGASALLVVADSLFVLHRARIAELAAGSAGEMNFGVTSVAAPNAASSSTAIYSSTARLDTSGAKPSSAVNAASGGWHRP